MRLWITKYSFIITRSTRFNVSGYGMECLDREAEAAGALILWYSRLRCVEACRAYTCVKKISLSDVAVTMHVRPCSHARPTLHYRLAPFIKGLFIYLHTQRWRGSTVTDDNWWPDWRCAFSLVINTLLVWSLGRNKWWAVTRSENFHKVVN